MIYLELFLTYCKIGLLSFGGGYGTLPLIQQEIVENQGWITMQEFTDIVTISQMTPGPIGINAATFVGTKIAGVPGAILASLGAVFPSLVIVLSLAFLYYKYQGLSFVQSVLASLRPCVIAFITAAGGSLMYTALFPVGGISWFALSCMIIGMVVFRLTKISSIQFMLFSGLAGVIYYGIWL